MCSGSYPKNAAPIRISRLRGKPEHRNLSSGAANEKACLAHLVLMVAIGFSLALAISAGLIEATHENETSVGPHSSEPHAEKAAR